MNLWTVVGLSVSAVLVGLGIALGQASNPALGTICIVAGGASSAVVLTIWAAVAMGLGRHSKARTRASSARVDALIADLSGHARTAHEKGVLMLADARVAYRQRLFAEGARRLVSADPAAEIRETLSILAETDAQREFAGRQRVIAFCRVLPVGALSIGLVSAMWMLIASTRGEQVAGAGSATASTALALLCAVYGSFAIAALAGDAADRLRARTAEDELAASLIIEAIVALRQGETPDMVAARLRGMIPPTMSDVPQPSRLRSAA